MNDSLDGALRAAASTIDIPPGDLDRVVTRGHGRMRRNKRLARVGTTLALVVMLLAAVNALDRSDEGVPLRVGSPAAQRGDIAIDWARQDAPGLGEASSAVEDAAGTLYTLSTAPGETSWNTQRVVWRSGDGLNWSPKDRPGDLYLSDLSARGNRLYAAGTTPATARTTRGKEVADRVVAWSDDGAQTWQRARLPIDMEGIAARSTAVIGLPGRVTATARGIVTVTQMLADPDLSTLLRQGTEASTGWAVGPTGIDILDAGPPHCPSGTKHAEDAPGTHKEADGRVRGAPCELSDGSGSGEVVSPQEAFGVTTTYTWNDLGVGDDLRRAFLGVPIVLRAGDDGTFTAVEGALPDDTQGATVIAAPDGAFVLFADTPAGVQVSTSHDGATWQSAPPVSRLRAVFSAGWFGDRLALSGPIDARGTVGLVVGMPSEGWHEIDLREIAGIDGPVSDSFLWVSESRTGTSGIVATFGETGNGGNGDVQLLVSRDGATWSVSSLDQLVGAHVAGASAKATSRGPMVFARLQSTSHDEPGRRVLLMGTYR